MLLMTLLLLLLLLVVVVKSYDYLVSVSGPRSVVLICLITCCIYTLLILVCR